MMEPQGQRFTSLKEVKLLRFMVAAIFLLATLVPVNAGDQMLAPRFWRSPVFACDGTQHHDNGFLLDPYNWTFVKSSLIVLVKSAPGQTGVITLSMNVADENGQYQMGALVGAETKAYEPYGGNSWPVAPAQSLTYEWNCHGGGERQFIATIGYSAAP